MNFRLSPLLSFTVLVATAVAAGPAADGPPIEFDKVAVTGERVTPFTVPTIEAARATLRLVPGGIEVVSAERYLRGRASTLEDTFGLSAGVIAQSRFGSDEARLSIRGSGLQRTFHGRGIRVLQDGVPLNLADGSFDMQAIEPLSAAYISVWRGANALASGASTLGGAIDYTSHTGHDAPPFARLEAGSWNYLRANLSAGGVRGAADGYASFTHQQQDGFRDHAEQRNERLFANAGYRFSSGAETRFSLTGVHTASELPGNVTKEQLNANPRQAAIGNLALDQQRNFELLRIATKTTVRTGETIWDFTAAWTYKDLDHPIFQVIDQLSNDLLLGADALYSGDVAGRAHRLCAGVRFTQGTINAANYINVAGNRGALVAAAHQTATNLETYAEDQLALAPKFTLVLGASASANHRESDQTVGATPDYDLDYSRFMPKLGLRWDSGDVQVYTNLSASYEPPSFSETLTLNTARRAQTATTWELGTRGTHRFVRWDASIYYAALENELLTLDHDNNPSTAAATVNADQTTHSGIELATEVDLLGASWDTDPAHRLVFRAAWTYGRFRFDDDPQYGDNTLAGLPPHLIRGELSWETASGWYAGATFAWAPEKTYIDFRNTYAADSYLIAGLRVGRRLARGFSWFAEARNLADKKYSATTGVIENAHGDDQPQFLPGDGRSFFGGIEYRW